MEITNGYNRYIAQSITASGAVNIIEKKEAAKAAETAKTDTSDYFNELKKLAPSVEFKVGNTFSSAKTGETLTISPVLLEKMQNDPEQEKETKELIKGVEMMTMFSESMNKASGWKTVFRHSYIDENGKYCHIALIRNEHGYKISEKLRAERKKNSEKLIEKSKQKAAKKKEEAAKAENKKDKSDYDSVKQFLKEKIADSKDGSIYINDKDFHQILKAVKEYNAGFYNKNGSRLNLQA